MKQWAKELKEMEVYRKKKVEHERAIQGEEQRRKQQKEDEEKRREEERSDGEIGRAHV